VDTGALSLVVKRLGREADHSPLSSAEVKECAELCLHSPNTPSWRGAQLKAQRRLYLYVYGIYRKAVNCKLLAEPQFSFYLEISETRLLVVIEFTLNNSVSAYFCLYV
jgi:hypothetical protein